METNKVRNGKSFYRIKTDIEWVFHKSHYSLDMLCKMTMIMKVFKTHLAKVSEITRNQIN